MAVKVEFKSSKGCWRDCPRLDQNNERLKRKTILQIFALAMPRTIDRIKLQKNKTSIQKNQFKKLSELKWTVDFKKKRKKNRSEVTIKHKKQKKMTTKTTTVIKCWMCLKEIETGEGFDFGCENHHHQQKQKQKSKTESEPAPSATVSTSTKKTTRVDDKGKGERKIVCSKCSEIVIEFEKKKKKKTTKMKKGKEEEEEMCLICGGIKQVGEGGDVIKFKKVDIEVATTEPKEEEKCPFCMKNEAKIECKTCEMISCSSKECLDRVHVAHAAMRKKARHAEEMIEIGKEEGEEMEKKEDRKSVV